MDIKKMALMSLGATAAAIPAIGYALSIPFCIRSEKVSFRNLPSHLRGLKILHIADFHARHSQKKHINIWPYLKGLQFDMAVFTGDIILDEPGQLYPHLKDLQALAKRVPTFYVDGNHEKYCCDQVAKLLESIGVITLLNRSGNFVIKSSAVPIVGFREYGYLSKRYFADLESMSDDFAKSGFHIILCHQPQIFNLLDKRVKSGLVLVGHTHGGQLRLPFMPTLYAPGQGAFPKYGDGWYTNESNEQLKMFISRGVGSTHFPLRMFNPPELVVIELLKD